MKHILLSLLFVALLIGEATAQTPPPVEVLEQESTPWQTVILIRSDTVPRVDILASASGLLIGGGGMYKDTYRLIIWSWCPWAHIWTTQGTATTLTLYERPCYFLSQVRA